LEQPVSFLLSFRHHLKRPEKKDKARLRKLSWVQGSKQSELKMGQKPQLTPAPTLSQPTIAIVAEVWQRKRR